jgi:hypothetical protein
MFIDSSDHLVKLKDHAGAIVAVGGLADPGTNGIVKRTAANATAPAIAGTDYYAPGGAIAPADLPFPGAAAKGGILTTTCSGGQVVTGYTSAGTPTCATIPVLVASGSLALATSAITSGCQTVTAGTVNSAAATGVLATDVISWTPSGSLKAVAGFGPGTTGGLSIVAYPTAGYVNFDVCNWSSASITPGAVTLNWRVAR